MHTLEIRQFIYWLVVSGKSLIKKKPDDDMDEHEMEMLEREKAEAHDTIYM